MVNNVADTLQSVLAKVEIENGLGMCNGENNLINLVRRRGPVLMTQRMGCLRSDNASPFGCHCSGATFVK